MIEDIIEKYKKTCTRVGQFSNIFNGWKIVIYVVFVGGILGIILNLWIGNTENMFLHFIKMYLLIIPMIIIELLYIRWGQKSIFKTEKQSIITKMKWELKNVDPSDNKVSKDRINRVITGLEKFNFNKKYIWNTIPIENIYFKLKFEEFVTELGIDEQKSELIKKTIHEYLKDNSNFKEAIDTAFLGLIFMAILNPIIEYFQAICIPTTSTSLNSTYFLIYLMSVVFFAVCIFGIYFSIQKFNDNKNSKEKRLLLRLHNKLSGYNFEDNKLEDYLCELETVLEKIDESNNAKKE